MDAKWLLATWQLQVALGSGYAAYMIAYTGIRSHHQAIDTTFRSLAFGLVATAIMLAMPVGSRVASIAVASGGTVLAGLFWRRFGMRGWEGLLRFLDITWADDTPSAWAKLSMDETHHITQITVMTKDGAVYSCNDAERCGGFPLGPCILGTNGDVLMYTTHIRKPGEEQKERQHLEDEHYGVLATYLPATVIERIEIRRKPVPKRTPVRNAARRLVSRFRPAAAAAAADPRSS